VFVETFCYHGAEMKDASKEFLTEKEVADFLCVSARTVQEMRYANKAPPHVVVAPRCIRYKRVELMRWLDKKTVQPVEGESESA